MQEELEIMLTERTKNDCIYQTLLRECMDAETAYEAFAETLPEENREILERYLSACEELEHRRTTLALSLNK